MNANLIDQFQGCAGAIARAKILEILKSGEILAEVSGDSLRRVLCDFLQSATANQIVLEPGDDVLVLTPESPDAKGCVVGKVGLYQPPKTDRVELCADEELTLRCGKGSITVTSSGQILIQGLDIVSHAKRSNRLRGGSIQLN